MLLFFDRRAVRWFDSARECAVLLRTLEATLVSDKQPHSRTVSLIGTAVPMMHELVELIYDKQQSLVTPSVQVQSVVHFQSVRSRNDCVGSACCGWRPCLACSSQTWNDAVCN